MGLGILLLLVASTAAFYRDFSHFGIPVGGVVIYVTEMALLSVCCLLGVRFLRRGEIRWEYSPLGLVVLAYMSWGMICLFRGRGDGLTSLRDAATNYYALFFVLIPLLCRQLSDVRRVYIAILVGTVGACAVIGLHIVGGIASATSTGALRYHSYIGVGAVSALFWVLSGAVKSHAEGIRNGLFASALVAVIVVATQHRSAAIALGCSLIAWVAVLSRGRLPGSIGGPVVVGVVVAVTALGVAFFGQLGTVTVERLGTIGPQSQDFNVQWRLAIWAALISGVYQSPLVGHGFGANFPAIVFRDLAYGLDPTVSIGAHNSYLWVAFKEGMLGVGLLALVIGGTLWQGIRAVFALGAGEGRRYAAIGVASFIYVALYAGFNVVLEGPYMGMFFWLYAGLTDASIRIQS